MSVEKLLSKEKKYLVAFSGGPDSVYLLLKLVFFFQEKLRDHISLIYVNYHDSPFVKDEEDIVKYYQKKYELSLYQFDVYPKRRKISNFEEWARDYRYHLFSKVGKKEGFDAVLTAHQKTDVVETYLLQKERGNLPLYYGLKEETALFSFPLIRPILEVSKKEIIEELQREKILFYDDITNQDLTRKRNSLRVSMREEEISSYLSLIEQENQKLCSLYQSFQEHQQGMTFSCYESFSEEEKRRYCFYLLDCHRIKKGKEGIGKRMYDFLKRKAFLSLMITPSLTLYKTEDSFFLSYPFEKLSYSYTFHQKKRYQTKYFTIDLSDPSQFNIKQLPVTIRNYHPKDQMETKMKIKDVEEFLKRQGVPKIYQPLFPVIIENDNIIATPFYCDIKKKKIPLVLTYTDGVKKK